MKRALAVWSGLAGTSASRHAAHIIESGRANIVDGGRIDHAVGNVSGLAAQGGFLPACTAIMPSVLSADMRTVAS